MSALAIIQPGGGRHKASSFPISPNRPYHSSGPRMSQPHGSEPVTLTRHRARAVPRATGAVHVGSWRNAWRVVLTIHGRLRLRPCDHNAHRGSGFLKLSACDLWADHCTCGTCRRLLHDYQGVNPPVSARAGAAPTFFPMNRGTDRRSGASGRSVSGCPSIGSTSEPPPPADPREAGLPMRLPTVSSERGFGRQGRQRHEVGVGLRAAGTILVDSTRPRFICRPRDPDLTGRAISEDGGSLRQ